jgi:hypothetical protein
MYTRRAKGKPTLLEILIVFAIAAILLTMTGGILSAILFPFLNVRTHTIKVDKVENVVHGSGESVSSKYLVFTEDIVYENTDCFVRFKFDSSDFHNKLDKGGEFKVKTCGYRIPFLSTYENIIEIY